MVDNVFMLTHMDYVQETRDLIGEIGDFIFRLKDYVPDKENIRLRREGLTSSSLEDLCAQAHNSTEAQWRMQPSFFGALTLEYQCRIDAAISLMPKE